MIPGYHVHLFSDHAIADPLESLQTLEVTGAAVVKKGKNEVELSPAAISAMENLAAQCSTLKETPRTPEGLHQMVSQAEDFLWGEELAAVTA